MDQRRIRIGIDVGGTFTHAVAVDNRTYEIIADAVTPTTHSSEYSVSEGIIKVFADVLAKGNIRAEDVIFVAHSTTQATNALLEGDVAKVGIIGMGKGLESIKAKADTSIPDIELSEGKYLHTAYVYLDSSVEDLKNQALKAIDKLKNQGCTVIIASEAFSVDNATNEDLLTSWIEESDIPATSSHEISQLYGLRIRTRTAVVNASILPKMTQTANLTDESIRKSKITAPLMIMRSDGGVMDIAQMKKRPILTLLSGPAAGIASALMYANVSDGIFLEVGGTSTDISAIKNGKAMLKSANIGGHTTYLRTLDSRTVGIGGGSMVRIRPNGSVIDTGPRSAHIAGFSYLAFANHGSVEQCHVETISPLQGDPADYVVLKDYENHVYALTLTDAAMFAGVSKKGDYAYGNIDNVKKGFALVAEHYKRDAYEVAEDILNHAAKRIRTTIDSLQSDYDLDMSLVSLVGGGGGCTAIVPWVANCISMKYIIAKNAEVISAIGAAMAMLRDMVEKTVINPTPDDIASVRKQAIDSLLSMGAEPSSIEVQMEVDRQINIIRAVATGGIQMQNQEMGKPQLSQPELQKIAQTSLKQENALQIGKTDHLVIYSAAKFSQKLFGIVRSKQSDYRVMDLFGTIKLQVNNGDCYQTDVNRVSTDGHKYLENISVYSDAGQVLPQVFMIYGSRIADYSSILKQDEVEELIRLELKGLNSKEPIFLLIKKR